MTRAVIRRPAPRPRTAEPDVDMSTVLAGVELPSPVLTASGCAAAGRELDQFFDITAIGAVVTKSIMLNPRSGRPTPRMAETPSGMLNSIGLQGPGIDAFLDRDLAWLHDRGARVVVSIAGGTVDEYAKLSQRLRHVKDLVAIEVNISCPNVEDRGQVFACDRDSASAVVSAVRRNSDPRVPVLAKLSPDVTDIVTIAESCVDAGANGLSVINTTLGMVIDTGTMRPALAGITGGLSGPAIRPIAVRCVWQIRQALPEIPILGMGGIRTGLDALEFVLAGAQAVSVGTVVFNDPSAPIRVQRELAVALAERGFSSLADAVSYAHRPADPEPAVAAPTPPQPDPGPDTASLVLDDLPEDAPEEPSLRWRPEPDGPPPRRSSDPDTPFDQESDW
jgi:dihydroorotate dehydrogenase (NAD+) catalytic subunit